MCIEFLQMVSFGFTPATPLALQDAAVQFNSIRSFGLNINTSQGEAACLHPLICFSELLWRVRSRHSLAVAVFGFGARGGPQVLTSGESHVEIRVVGLVHLLQFDGRLGFLACLKPAAGRLRMHKRPGSFSASVLNRDLSRSSIQTRPSLVGQLSIGRTSLWPRWVSSFSSCLLFASSVSAATYRALSLHSTQHGCSGGEKTSSTRAALRSTASALVIRRMTAGIWPFRSRCLSSSPFGPR